MTIKPISTDSTIIYFKQKISEEVLTQVQQSFNILKKLNGIIDITPSYCSILIKYDLNIYNYKSIKKTIQNSMNLDLDKTRLKLSTPKNIIKIPTTYNERDLKRVAQYNNITVEEVIKLHTQKIYRVYAIGFMVGFAYLAEVDKKIVTPRLETPRAKIPKGSVAIADNQTAIYPQDSAGGWNIIGHIEFDRFEEFGIGDYVQFERINEL
jgi:KipI family sensor histidine kinase inhibitor